jgi:LCP family protein required for cell wall assembly
LVFIAVKEKIRLALEWIRSNPLAVKRLLLISGSIAAAAFFLSFGAGFVLWVLDDSGSSRQRTPISTGIEPDPEITPAPTPAMPVDNEISLIPQRTNFLLSGLDTNLLADAIMVGTFYRDSGNIHLMSVPRDMVTQIPPHRMEAMRADGLRPPSILKINELRTHGGRQQGIHYIIDHISEMFGVEFDFYVEVEIPAFRRIVDAIDGVEMHIPKRLFYVDPCQNLRIDVPAGLVKLDGRMAEGVVRYRQWPMGDLQRNQMQMEFMTALIQQAVTREALLNDPRAIIATIIEDVRTDMGILTAFLYIPMIQRVNLDSINTFTMPGRVGHVSGREYFIPDRENLPAVISDVFYSVFEAAESDEDEHDDD